MNTHQKYILSLFAFISFFFEIQYANAAIYFVATTGNDANPGTISSPFQTVAYGAGVLQPGDTLYIRSGTYTVLIDSDIPSGTSWSVPVTIAAYPGEIVILQPPASQSTGPWPMLYMGNRCYIILDRLIFDGSSTTDPIEGLFLGTNAHHICFRNGEVKNFKSSGLMIDKTSHHNEFTNMTVHDNGINDFDHGIYIEGADNLVENSDFYQNAGWGVHMIKDGGTTETSRNVVRNNRIHDNAKVGPRGAGVAVGAGADNMIYNNLIWGNIGGIQISPTSPASGAMNTLIYNNTIYSNTTYGIRIQGSSTGTVFKNNILYLNTTTVCGNEYCNSGSGTVSSNNLTGTNPLFVNSAGADFHLQPGSSAMDAGINLSPDVTDDFEGTPRPQGAGYDIGAFEYVNTTGISEPSAQNEIIVFPNPSSGIFAVETKNQNYTFEIMDIIGKSIFSSEIKSGRTKIDLSKQPDGIYILKINEAEAAKKIVISR